MLRISFRRLVLLAEALRLRANLRAEQSVPRHPALAVASYSMLLLAALQSFGPGRTADYPLHPKWRKDCKRPSFLDLVTLLRRDSNHLAEIRPGFTRNFTIYDADDQVSLIKSIFRALGLDETAGLPTVGAMHPFFDPFGFFFA